MSISSQYPAELIDERSMTPTEVWAAAEQRLSRHPSQGLNTAVEVCDRWSADRSRLAIIVRHSPDTPAERWTYMDMARASSRLAAALIRLGVNRGDRIAALLPQGIEAHLAAIATWRLGAIFVPLYPGFGVDAVAQRVGSAAPTVVIVDQDSGETLEEALSKTGTAPAVIGIRPRNAKVQPAPGLEFWDQIERHDASVSPVNTAASDTATLLYTSGTTGIPKGCLLPHSYLLTMQPFVRHSLTLDGNDMFASTSSPGWVNGLYSTGACVSAEGKPRVIYTGRFDAKAWLDVLCQERVTYLSSAPSALRHLLPACEELGFPATLRAGASAGEHQGAALSEAWERFCASPLQETYGTTEIGLVLATPAYDKNPHDMGALPAVLPGFEVALMDDAGQFQDESGIIAVRNPGYVGCTGYLDAEDQWAKRWRGDWYLTGDLARRDDRGQLWFCGRDDDLIVTAGYNIGPTEVESVIRQHPQVSDVAVVSAPDQTRGSVVRAVVVTRDDVAVSHHARLSADLKDLVRARLGRHAYPRVVEFTTELPRNPAGKVQRNLLRENYRPSADIDQHD